MLRLYFAALWRQWKALLMGGSLTAVIVVYSLATGKQVALPFGWAVLGLTLFTASYLAWRENYPQTTQPPEISLGNSGALFHVLWLKNLGHSATFRAELRILESNVFHDSVIGPQGPLWWETEQRINVWLPTGGSDWIILARRDLFTFFRFNATMRSTVPLLDGMGASERPYVVCEISLFGDPPFEGGELTRRFRYERFGQSPGDIRLVPVDA